MSAYRELALSYLRSVVEQTGKSATELARLAEVSPTTFTRPLNNPDFKYAPKFQALRAVSQATGVELPEDLISAVRQEHAAAPAVRYLAVEHELAAGVFREENRPKPAHIPHHERTITGAHRRISVASVPGYDDSVYQWLERVGADDSMDRLFPAGTLLHVAYIKDIDYSPKAGDVVIVERVRAHGTLVERSAKQIVIGEVGDVELWPRSHNFQWDKPIIFAPDALSPVDEAVIIVGKVIRAYLLMDT